RFELFKEGIDLSGNRLPAAFTVNFHGYHLILLYHILKPEYSVISRRKAAERRQMIGNIPAGKQNQRKHSVIEQFWFRQFPAWYYFDGIALCRKSISRWKAV
ncbi:hypothetical protein, partial [Holdemania filiformis]|uniref:hypothetical protein n=1 Tax=Holdemania filiformis TaxID=61171 RepID=UPI00242F3E3C